MAEKVKGNIFYEIIILILVVILLGSILYPSRIWNKENENEVVCRNRMETIQLMELQYITRTGLYTDSLAALKGSMMEDEAASEALDTTIIWEKMVPKEDLKKLVFSKRYPDDQRSVILSRLNAGKPLGTLGQWDSLAYRLLSSFKAVVRTGDASKLAQIDVAVSWPLLVGEDTFWSILESPSIPANLRTRSVNEIRRSGIPVTRTAGWNYSKPIFYKALEEKIALAESKDFWTADQQEKWEEYKQKLWNEEMDALPQAVKDSIWNENQRRLWDSNKELIWKKERMKLYKTEKTEWMEQNRAIWEQVLDQRWKSERKKTWTDAFTLKLAKDTLAVAPAQEAYVDSIWNTAVDSLRNKEYSKWESKNRKMKEETLYNLWSGERRMLWEEGAYSKWIEDLKQKPDVFWKKMKDELWMTEKGRLWRNEEERLSRKIQSIKDIDQAVPWQNVLEQDQVTSIVNSLSLPSAQDLWKMISTGKTERGSLLYKKGVSGMFSSELINAIDECPVAHLPYLISVTDTSAIKYFSVTCPIVDKAKANEARRVDPVTLDTTFVPLKLAFVEKIFGGGSIKYHGNIDTDGKKSWERKGR